jgi:NAD(P)-dependent dehydrogenase (short-subunit alcohol dehydrogenase family)
MDVCSIVDPRREEGVTMSRYRGAVAIVTGGASGIGRALCEELGRRGAAVIVTDINAGGAENVASGIAASGGSARSAFLDVTCAEDVRVLVEEIAADQGRLDYVFNNAGICTVGEVRDMSLAQWRRLIDVNLWGVIHGSMAAYQVMLRQGFGHIVNLGSADGLMPFPMMTAYSTTKHAVIGFSTSLRAEAAGLGINVTVACPGLVRSGMQDATTLVTKVRDRDALQGDLATSRVAIGADECAKAIMRGVERNKGIIVVTAFARICWWLYRLHPALIAPLNRAWIDAIRGARMQ